MLSPEASYDFFSSMRTSWMRVKPVSKNSLTSSTLANVKFQQQHDILRMSSTTLWMLKALNQLLDFHNFRLNLVAGVTPSILLGFNTRRISSRRWIPSRRTRWCFGLSAFDRKWWPDCSCCCSYPKGCSSLPSGVWTQRAHGEGHSSARSGGTFEAHLGNRKSCLWCQDKC